MNARRRAGVVVLLAVISCLALPLAGAWAHPLGNFTTNTHAGIVVTPTDVRIDYVLDLAEVPAFQAVRDDDLDSSGALDGPEGEAYASRRCDELADGLFLTVAGRAADLALVDHTVSLPPGEAGLVTLRLECTFATTVPPGTADGGVRIDLRDTNADGRVGWREITATGQGMRLTGATVDESSLSDRLRAYPEDLLLSPLDQRTATMVATADGSAAPPPIDVSAADQGEGLVARGIATVDGWFTGLVARTDLTVPFALLATLGALGLGALHSLAPGHGKTVMAAYVVGREGTNRQALQLAVTVAVTHTAGIFILGIVLSSTQAFAPEQLYPYLGLASGLIFAAVGAALLRRALARLGGHGHSHGHAHDHGHDHGQAHHPHVPAAASREVAAGGADGDASALATAVATTSHEHPIADGQHDHGQHGHSHAPPDGGLTWRSLIAPGLAGGLVPSPSALLVLLGGIALGRAWFGVLLVIAYGIGMAATLVGAGYLLLMARKGIERRAAERGWARAERLSGILPIGTASMILVIGLLLAGASALSI